MGQVDAIAAPDSIRSRGPLAYPIQSQDPDTIEYELTVTDPNLYSRPWTISTKAFVRAPEGHRLYEYACYEGNRTTDLITSGNK